MSRNKANYENKEAEGVGFEPTVAHKATTVFETAPIVHSGTPPECRALYQPKTEP